MLVSFTSLTLLGCQSKFARAVASSDWLKSLESQQKDIYLVKIIFCLLQVRKPKKHELNQSAWLMNHLSLHPTPSLSLEKRANVQTRTV